MCTAISCRSENRIEPQIEIRFAMPDGSSVLTDALIDIYRNRFDDAMFSRTGTPGTVLSADYVDNGSAEVTLIPSDVAYIAFTKGTESAPNPHAKLRGMAMLYANAIHLLVSKHINFRDLDDLIGKSIGVGPRGGNTDFTVRAVLPYLGIPLSKVHLEQVPRDEMEDRFADDSLDAGFIGNSYPAGSVRTILENTDARLVSVEGPRVDELRRQYPFLRPVTIPTGVYGSDQIATVATNWLLVCREDLGEDVVYRMLDIFVDSLEELSLVQPALLSAAIRNYALTPIPLHAGAARFYRELELVK